MPPIRIGRATKAFRQDVAAAQDAVRLGPERVAMEERRTVAEPQRQGAGVDAAQPGGLHGAL